MTEKPISKTPVPARNSTLSRKDGLLLLLVMAGLILIGIVFSVLINWFDIDNKVDVANYPGSEKASLTAKGTTFIENKYTSDKPISDYYKVRLTPDSCKTVLDYYHNEAAKSGWNIEKQGISAGVNVLVDSYRKSSKALFIYCTPGSQQLAQNADNKNLIVTLASDSVLDLNPSTGGSLPG